MGIPTRAVLAQRCRDSWRPALIEGCSGRAVSWAEVASGVAGWDDVASRSPLRVGLALGDPLAMASNYLGALAAGVTVAPLNPDGAPAEIAAQVAALGLAAVVTDTQVPEMESALSSTGSALWLAGPHGPVPWIPAASPPPAGLPGGAALIMMSSGTTGEPKVIPVSETQLLHTARGVVDHLGLDAGQRGLSPLPLWHINGLVVGVLSAAVAGSSLVVDRRFSRRRFWDTVEAYRPTWCNLVPAMLNVLAADERCAPANHRIRLARSASAPLPAAVRQRFEDRFGIPVVETYGMTEPASQITANPLESRRPGSVGVPVGLELRIVDDADRSLKAGACGRVQIRGASVTADYWAKAGTEPSVRPALVAGGWLPTGDVGHLDGDGYLWLVGRDDDVINRGGEKVQPREVEEVLASDPRVEVAVVVGRPHPRVGHEPVAYVLALGAEDPWALADELNDRCVHNLSRHKRPAAVVVLDAMPLGPTGKPRRAELRRLAAGSGSGAPVSVGAS